ncbi:pentapeptide repeat-containing protein [Pontibacter sp. SGAir0037]|uniref:pentapeptide repeat-containing protein n=1 Tax=Pontibacter sp. SGAir0037 TaxID=2571030 RepID=UPI0010CCEA5A|nr:pentapeptide repeat-containing protein [Pontibacter sp. SGAir0037]QCR23832.1 hypothetical protein C1N53_16745 [Pontibacter sp. SGAir0037]
MKKSLYLLLAFALLPLLSMAQTKVNASEVLDKINRGEAVSYRDAEIIGDLNMTRLENMKLKKKGSNEYISTVVAPVSFVNCTFRGDVLAYENSGSGSFNLLGNSSDEVYNTDFEKEVRFENCEFKKKSALKYSHFNGTASFAGSRFAEEALFKYSKFSGSINFSKVRFNNYANFKYVTFPVAVNFNQATFGSEADFKYAKFPEGVDFGNAAFNGMANFKYAEIADPINLKGASFKGGDDFKYTKINNRSVTLSYLLEKSR